MGQTRVVKVWRLVVKDSIEARILEMTKKLTSSDRYSAAEADSAGASSSSSVDGGSARKRGKSASWEEHARQHDSAIQAAGALTMDRARAMKLEELEVLFKAS